MQAEFGTITAVLEYSSASNSTNIMNSSVLPNFNTTTLTLSSPLAHDHWAKVRRASLPP
jgi:hypothetical protein